MGLAMRQVDLERLDRALTTILSPLAHQRCDDGVSPSSRQSRNCSMAITSYSGCPRRRADARPFHERAAKPQRAIQTLFGRLPDLPPDPWLQKAERERLQSRAEVWSRARAFWRAAAGQPAALRRSAFVGEVLTPGRMCDSENVDWSVADGHIALCISYGNVETSVRSRRSPRHAAGALLRLLLPALKVGVTMRLASDREVAAELTLGRFGLTRREAQIARLLARRATNREIADQLDVSPHTVRHHVENIFTKLGIHSRRSIVSQFA